MYILSRIIKGSHIKYGSPHPRCAHLHLDQEGLHASLSEAGLYQEDSHASLSEAGLYQEGSHASLSEAGLYQEASLSEAGLYQEDSHASLINVAHAYCCKWRLKANVSNSAVVVFARELRGILELGLSDYHT